MQCHFCDYDLTNFKDQKYRPSSTFYHCPVCGEIRLTEEAAADFEGERFSENQKKILSIVLRNDFENRGRKPPKKPLNLNVLYQYLKQFVPIDPLEKMDTSLLILDKAGKTAGQTINVPVEVDFSYYHCVDSEELKSILRLNEEEKYISSRIVGEPERGVWITAKGYERLRELKRLRKDSRQCFVAMWFNTGEMGEVYGQAIQPAIEYIEDGATEPRFRAVRVDNVEHVNDINDEIIAQIRRSRFMVCDLTGYRGGVYFEAGFAYGLGLPVIYTCRKDWCDEDELVDKDSNVVKTLKDSYGNDIRVMKEGVHFDLAHMSRIEWEIDELDEFKVKLENKIKAVIV